VQIALTCPSSQDQIAASPISGPGPGYIAEHEDRFTHPSAQRVATQHEFRHAGNVVSEHPLGWLPEPSLAAALTRHYEDILGSYRSKPELIDEHANLEESIRTGGYADRTLLELVQNAADAITTSEDEDLGRVEILLDAKRNVLYCANSGRPFSEAGLRAVSMAHLSGKRGDEIGRFGLGFKSVLAVSSHPQIFSRSVSFEFNSLQAQERLRAVKDAPRLPVLRTPVLIDAQREAEQDSHLADMMAWASTVVKLPGARNIPHIRHEIENFAAEFLLFVPGVRELRLRIIGGSAYDERFATRPTGTGRYALGTEAGPTDEWLVETRMHRPSYDARREVGEAVARSEIRISVAVPLQPGNLRRGRFWSYFPLQDETSATALFNAPWSVNDDRTTLLGNRYNQEILQAVSEMFVDLLPHLSTPEDPAAHLAYMPARGRESHGLGDEHLTTEIPRMAAQRALIPDAAGRLRSALEITPLDFAVRLHKDEHEGWSRSPHTGSDVPHWSCYQNDTRLSRTRDLYVLGRDPGLAFREPGRATDSLPRRGFQTWLREWAEGPDPISAANALRTVQRHRTYTGIDMAAVIPTNRGMRSLRQHRIVFLHRDDDLDVDDAAFVSGPFLAQEGIEAILRKEGFRDPDPEAVLRARLARLEGDQRDENLTKLWDAVLDVPHKQAARILEDAAEAVKVPTLDGGWAWPSQVMHLETDFGGTGAHALLDTGRCLTEVARALGVTTQPVRNHAFDDELFFAEYRAWVLEELARIEGPGAPEITDIEFDSGSGPGPFSALVLLHRRWTATHEQATRSELERWTGNLMRFLQAQPLTCEDLASGNTYEVDPPAVWALREYGLVKSSRGSRRVRDTVAPKLGVYSGLIPVFNGAPEVAAALRLPETLDEVPSSMLREALLGQFFPSNIKDDVLVEFILAASRSAFCDERPATVPARVSKVVEPTAPDNIFLATDDEQQQYLQTRGRAFLRVGPTQVRGLVTAVGCRTFEDNFSFTEIIEGRTQSEQICDVYSGLRQTVFGRKLGSATLSRAARIAKRVTIKEGGVEDQPLDWYQDGHDLVVLDLADDHNVLHQVSEAFSLGMSNADIVSVLTASLDHKLEKLRHEAASAPDDAARLALYIGDDDLLESLPSGLWSALRAQGLVNERTSVAELFLVVYGADALKQLVSRV